jgi:transcription initiation factor IIE alpha subunit
VHFVYHILMLIKSKKWQTVTEVVGFKCERCGKDVACDDNYEHQSKPQRIVEQPIYLI